MKIIGTEGMTAAQVRDEVGRGGKFVTAQILSSSGAAQAIPQAQKA